MADKGVSLKKSYAALNEALVKLFDELGVKRSFTVPYLEGQEMHEHVDAVGQAAQQSGGLTNNLITTAHHSDGKGWGSPDGHTVGHPSDKLRTTIIPADDENAKSAIEVAQKHINNMGKLLGDDDPTIQTANSQLNLVKKNSGQGMTLLDFGVLLIQIMFAPLQTIARKHSQTHPDGPAPHLRGSKAQEEPAEGQPEGQGEAQPEEGAPEGQEQDSDAQAAPEGEEQPAEEQPAQT